MLQGQSCRLASAASVPVLRVCLSVGAGCTCTICPMYTRSRAIGRCVVVVIDGLTKARSLSDSRCERSLNIEHGKWWLYERPPSGPASVMGEDRHSMQEQCEGPLEVATPLGRFVPSAQESDRLRTGLSSCCAGSRAGCRYVRRHQVRCPARDSPINHYGQGTCSCVLLACWLSGREMR